MASLQLVPSRADVQELDGSDAVIVELRSQLEDIWHEYASARRRNMTLMEESERMQSRIRNLEASLRQEQYHRQAAEDALAKIKEQCSL